MVSTRNPKENKSQEDTATQELGNPEYKVGLCLETRIAVNDGPGTFV